MYFNDRKDAGIQLAELLIKYKGKDVIVFALPRGGVVLALEIANSLQAPLDLVITKKIGHPGNPEYAICAMGENGPPVCNKMELDHVDPSWLEVETLRIRKEIQRRKETYHIENTDASLNGKIAILVDDGIATGLTMMAAINEIKSRKPAKIVVAIPITPADTARELMELADELIAIYIDENYLGAVGAYYKHFAQVEDEEVMELLDKVISKTKMGV